MTDLRALLARVADHAAAYRAGADEARVFPDAALGTARAALGGPLPDVGIPPGDVIEQLIGALEPVTVATAGPRYFGFVTGGALDSATAADVLAVGWDQLAYNHLTSPAAAIAEEVAGEWLLGVLGLPADASFGFVTGAQGANTVCLAAARHKVLADDGWDVERDGMAGAPRVRIVATEERHATIDRALRLLGFGAACLEPVATDANGALDAGALRDALTAGPHGPTVVCLQAGNVNTGACDPLGAAVAEAHEHGAWAHVDGAFGLWAGASARTRPLVDGVESADSWATDGHKWLNVPYDSGFAFCAHPDAHVAAMAYTAAYLTGTSLPEVRSPGDYVPESSRRARGVATWAALRELGRSGVADLVDRCCALAQRFASQLGDVNGITVANDVVLNQVLVRFGDDDATTDDVVTLVQRSGECWMGSTTWRGRRYMRISVSNWRTTERDVDRSVAAITRAFGESAGALRAVPAS
ncbi:MAG TPA: aminotransferase class V-fold PLP-dependent enzyme [Acidimicrobiales bacterium]|nr:aminotransferase class V-fold PLP-dependent enzyme [Acidimicrobiales bacterium]